MEQPGQEADVDFSEVYAMDRIGWNTRNINFCRIFVAIISGCAAGIMGFTGLMGFVIFLATTMMLSVMLFLKVSFEPRPFFKKPDDLWTEGISQAMMSYVMFWTLFYDIVHIY